VCAIVKRLPCQYPLDVGDVLVAVVTDQHQQIIQRNASFVWVNAGACPVGFVQAFEKCRPARMQTP
jgi:hypothetical protein